MYKFWKEVTYEEFCILCEAGVLCASNDDGCAPADGTMYPTFSWTSEEGWTKKDIEEPPGKNERFFVLTEQDG